MYLEAKDPDTNFPVYEQEIPPPLYRLVQVKLGMWRCTLCTVKSMYPKPHYCLWILADPLLPRAYIPLGKREGLPAKWSFA